MYNTHTQTHTFRPIQWWPPAQKEARAHISNMYTAYYHYEVLYTSDHQQSLSAL